MPKILKDEDIFAAVVQVVSECGYAGATTKQMAEAANVSEVTLFRKYGNKIQLVKRAVEAVIAQTDFETVTQYSGDVSADLLRVVVAYQSSAVKHGQCIFILLSEMPRYPELANLFTAPLTFYTNISQLLVRYQSEGVLHQEHPMHALAALLGPLIYGGMMRKAMINSDVPPLDLLKHVTIFLEGRQVFE
jgi:AcrR family transcriptional regulator